MALQKIPSPLLGLALGLMGLCVLLEHAFQLEGRLFGVGCIGVMPLVGIVACKYLLHPRVFIDELQHPVLGAIPVAGCMVTFQISQWMQSFCMRGAEIIWLISMAFSIAVPCFFYVCRWRRPVWEDRLPSWFLVLGGTLMGAPTVPSPDYIPFANAVMYLGDGLFFVLFPLVMQRILKRPDTIAEAMRPVVAICAAPVSLIIVTWVNTGHDWPAWGWGIYLLAVVLTLWVYSLLPKLLRLPFSPAKASLTFPMAISATASHKMAVYQPMLAPFALFETVVAVAVITFVCYEFARNFWPYR